MKRQHRRILAAFVVLTLGVAACGNSGDDDSASSNADSGSGSGGGEVSTADRDEFVDGSAEVVFKFVDVGRLHNEKERSQEAIRRVA